MHESIAQLQVHVRMIWRHRWLALVTAACLCLAGWSVVLVLPNKYEVSTKVFLDTSSMLRPLLKGLAANSNVQRDAIGMMRKTLLSRKNLETVARTTDMDLKVKTPEDMERLLAGLARSVRVSGGSRGNIFVIAYSNSEPRLAKKVVESFLNIFVERSLGETRKDTGKTQEFIDEQIRKYEARLKTAEERLKEFKRKNVGLLPSEGKNYYTQRQDVAAKISEVGLELKEEVQLRNSLRRQLSGEEPTFGMVQDIQVSGMEGGGPLAGRIEALEKRLDTLLLQYTEQHPDVVAIKRLIKTLKRQNLALIKQATAGRPVQDEQSITENPVYQELKIALGNSEAKVAVLRARLDEYTKREKDLEERFNAILKVETELKALNRDYEINHRNYVELVKRRESLDLSDEADKTSDEVQFRIIEPPRVPLLPSSPNRPLLSAAVLVVGLGGGIALAWLLSMLRPAFYSKEDIAGFAQVPVLGLVARVTTPRELTNRRIGYAVFAMGTFGLITLCGVLIALETMDVAFISKLAGLGGIM